MRRVFGKILVRLGATPHNPPLVTAWSSLATNAVGKSLTMKVLHRRRTKTHHRTVGGGGGGHLTRRACGREI